MKHAVIENIPENPRAIFDMALDKCYHSWIDEKGTEDHPSEWTRQTSKLSYEEAFPIIQENSPHWVISFRNNSYLSSQEKDYWEFGGCNIASGDYGSVFIWIQVDLEEAKEIFEIFQLEINQY